LKLRVLGTRHLLNRNGEILIESAIAQAEKITSGEIRVHIDKDCDIPVLDRAAEVFDLLQMNKTELRNGVLIYVSKRERQFAILGDIGINSKVPDSFWKETVDNMTIYFKNGDFTKGIIEGIESAGKQLQQYFPVKEGDINELNNRVSYGKNK